MDGRNRRSFLKPILIKGALRRTAAQPDRSGLPAAPTTCSTRFLRRHIEKPRVRARHRGGGLRRRCRAGACLHLVKNAEFKRKQAAPGLKVTDRAFGQPDGGCRSRQSNGLQKDLGRGVGSARHRRCIHSHSSGFRRTYISSTSVQRCVNSPIGSAAVRPPGGSMACLVNQAIAPRSRVAVRRVAPRGAPVRSASAATADVVAAGRPKKSTCTASFAEDVLIDQHADGSARL